jgi:hypothetical protein
MLARTPSTPRLFAHGSAIVAQTALRTGRRLTGRYPNFDKIAEFHKSPEEGKKITAVEITEVRV